MTPLRERREDSGLLITALLKKAGVESDGPRIAPTGARPPAPFLAAQRPELQQLLTRTWLFAQDGLMSGEPRFVSLTDSNAPAGAAPPARPLSTEDQGDATTPGRGATAARGNVTEAARALGTGRVQLHRVMRRPGIDAERFRQ
jgi:transcriptional regulator with GAF, ATPase, and Fis domain